MDILSIEFQSGNYVLLGMINLVINCDFDSWGVAQMLCCIIHWHYTYFSVWVKSCKDVNVGVLFRLVAYGGFCCWFILCSNKIAV